MARAIAVLAVLACIAVGTQALPLFKMMQHTFEGRRAAVERSTAARAFAVEDMPPAQWYVQTLDHFDGLNNATWKQRYYVNSTFWTKPATGPVFLYIEGEGAASPLDVLLGHHVEMAAKVGALIIAVEHRYYGASNPVSTLDVANMRYLSSQQALADLAQFHQFAVKNWNLTPANTWICFGGSYPGALSAFFRSKYPHLVYGAIASSAPVQAQVNFEGYNNVVAASLNATIVGGSEDCVANVKAAFAYIAEQVSTPAGLKDITTRFNTCKPVTTPLEVLTFVSNIAGFFQEDVQYNNEGLAQPTIQKLCSMMTDSKNDPVTNLIAISALSQNNACLDNSFKDSIASLMNTTVDPTANGVGIRQWTYQTCAQFGYYQTCDPNTQCIFSDLMTLESNTMLCNTAFGITDTEIAAHIDFTNDYYGGNQPGGTRIVFVNGSIDPWHWLSVLSSIPSQDITAVFIDGTAHCDDMMPSEPTDGPNVIAARAQIFSTIQGWLSAAAAEVAATH